MFVVSRRNIILPGPNGEKFRLAKGFMGNVPSWAEKSAYLKALAADGKVVISKSRKDKDVEKSAGEPPMAPPEGAKESGDGAGK